MKFFLISSIESLELKGSSTQEATPWTQMTSVLKQSGSSLSGKFNISPRSLLMYLTFSSAIGGYEAISGLPLEPRKSGLIFTRAMQSVY